METNGVRYIMTMLKTAIEFLSKAVYASILICILEVRFAMFSKTSRQNPIVLFEPD